MSYIVHLGSCNEALSQITPGTVQTCITSPPYFNLRDYGIEETEWPEIEYSPMAGVPAITIPAMKCCHGSEKDIMAYVAHEVHIFRGVREVLRQDGTLWLNLGDTYAANRSYQVPDNKHVDVGNASGSEVPSGLKQKDMIGIPWRVAYALQADGWYLRSWCPWIKLNSMPESCTDRPSVATETWFLLAKTADYYYDIEAVRQPHTEVSVNRVKRPFHLSQEVKERSVNSAEDGDMTRFCHPNGRNRRNTDGWFESIKSWFGSISKMIDDKGRGLVSSPDGEPLAIVSPTAQFKGAHFATFPQELIEPLILSGTSERGACPQCTAPFIRIMEKVGTFQRRWSRSNAEDSPYQQQGSDQNVYKEKGWRPSCSCYDERYEKEFPGITEEEKSVTPVPDSWESVPCIVLDIFSGSGTTGVVALRHGKAYIGCEINQQYKAMSEARLEDTVKDVEATKTLATAVRNPKNLQKRQAPISGLKSLFGSK